jgi:hypothetical protein
LGGRAIRRAVTRVKPEQASKVEMRMPTRLHNGEGRVSGEAIDKRTRLDPPGNRVAGIGGRTQSTHTLSPAYAMRTDSGRPSSSIRFRAVMATATSLA